MKNNWIRFCCFILLFSICFTMLNRALALRWGGWSDFYKLPKNSIDVLFLGNSHSYMSFQPPIVDAIIPVNSYALGIPGEGVILTYYELKEALKYQHPKVIVFETYTADSNTDINKGYFFRYIDNVRWDENKLAVILRYLFPEKLDAIFPSLRTRLEWEKPSLFFNQVSKYVQHLIANDIDPRRGSETFPNVISDKAFNDQKTFLILNNLKPLPENKLFLDKIVALARENNIKLVFTTTPILQLDPNHYDYSDPMDISGYAEKNNIPRILFDYTKLYQMHYYTESHVNSIGSLVLSTDMALALSKEIGLPVDTKALEGYQAFTFTGHSITKINNDYVIKINQADANSTLLYEWSLVQNGNVLQKTEWQSSSSFSFNPESFGDYQVDVQVKNPATGYIVKIDFPIIVKE